MTAGASVHPEKILKELNRVWVDLAKTEQQGVLRACSMTLIVLVPADIDDQELGENLAALMHEFPSRAIVVRVQPGAAPLEARVFAQCWMPFGKRQQICSEQIELTAAPSRLAEAAAVIRGVIVPDLPVLLFSPDPGLSALADFGTLLPLATKLITDTTAAEDSADALRRMVERRRSGLRCADLAWSLVTPWREAVAQIFDRVETRRAVYGINDVRILYAHADEPTTAYYLAGWFMHILGGEAHIFIARGVGPSYGRIARISLHGEGIDASVELMDSSSIQVNVNGSESALVFPPENRYAALREELRLPGPDPVFEQAAGLGALLRGIQP